MRTYTVQEALALPYDLPKTLPKLSLRYGRQLQEAYIQSYINFRFSSFYVPRIFLQAIWGGVGFVIFIGLIRQLLTHFVLPRHPQFLSKTSAFLDRNFFLVSRIRGHRIFWSGWKMSELVPIQIFNIANLVTIFVPYRHTMPNTFFPFIGFPLYPYIRYASDRSGVIAIGLTPLVVILAGRNNPVALLTGASYPTLQIYHRWTARWAYLHALIHALGYTTIRLMAGGKTYSSMFHKPYWNWGCVAIAGGSVLAICSFPRLRKAAYEVFLIGHILGAILWVVGAWYHLQKLDEFEYLHWIYAAVAAWSMDRFLRQARLWWLNFPRAAGTKRFNLRGRRNVLEAKGHLVSAGEFVRLRVTPARGWPIAVGGPGAYVFVASPFSWRSWGNHPLTIAWPADMPALQDRKGSNEDSEKGSVDEDDLLRPADPKTFELVLKRYDGFTHQLMKTLEKKQGDVEERGGEVRWSDLRLSVEGPYGEITAFDHLDSCLVVVGGSGLSAATARLAGFARAHCAGKLNVNRIVLLWSVRDYHSIHLLAPYLRPLAQYFKDKPEGFLDIQIHVTGAVAASDTHMGFDDPHSQRYHRDTNILEKQSSGHSTDSATVKESGGSTPKKVGSEIDLMLHAPASVPYTTHDGRADIGVYLDELLAWRGGKNQAVGVSACGPRGMCDDTREVVRTRMGGAQVLTFAEELFTW